MRALPQVLALATFSLLLVLFIGTRRQVQAGPGTEAGDNLIRVWSVGSPHTGALPQTRVPPELNQQAQKLGYTIVVENFRAAGFVAKLREAFQAHTAPEILTFDNFGVLIGVDTAAGRYQGVLDTDYEIASSLEMVYEAFATLQPRGWVVLVRPAVNHEVAKTLAMQPPRCHSELSAAQSPELQPAQSTAAEAARAYLTCDLPSLAAVSDESKLGDECFLPEENLQLKQLRPCNVSWHHNLAFVALAGTFTTEMRVAAPTRDREYASWLTNNALGQQSLLAVLRNRAGVWRLLAITDDPLNTGVDMHLPVQRLNGLLTDDAGTAPESARLLTPAGANLRPPPRRLFGDFTWTPSPSADVVCEVAEFLVGERSSLRERTRLFLLFGHEGRVSSGKIWGLLGHWRVWSIGKAGNLSLSETRSYLTW